MKNMYFFTYETDLPADVGYELFSPPHLGAIIVSFLMIVSITVMYAVSAPRRKASIRRLTAVIPVVLIIVRLTYVVLYGASVVYELPLHLCSMTGFFCFIYEFSLKNSPYIRSVLGQAMYSLCLPGALMAILFPNGTIYPIIHYISFESYLFHILIISYICIRICDKGIQPYVKEAYKSIVFLLVVVPPIFLFNVIFKTNYMFVIWPSAGSPLYGFYRMGGYAAYRIGYAITAVFVIYLMNILYIPVRLLQRRSGNYMQ